MPASARRRPLFQDDQRARRGSTAAVAQFASDRGRSLAAESREQVRKLVRKRRGMSPSQIIGRHRTAACPEISQPQEGAARSSPRPAHRNHRTKETYPERRFNPTTSPRGESSGRHSERTIPTQDRCPLFRTTISPRLVTGLKERSRQGGTMYRSEASYDTE